MPSQRRIKSIALIALVTILVFAYYHSAATRTRDSPFYTRTTTALDESKHKQPPSRQDHAQKPLSNVAAADKDSTKERLAEAEAAAKKVADERGKKFKQGVTGDEVSAAASGGTTTGDKTNNKKSVAGRVMMKEDENEKPGVAKVGGHSDQMSEREGKRKPETEREHMIEGLLTDILKKGPIIIFSKSYCPYSKKAKHILLQQHTIVPEPYVVELDLHEHGAELQSLLAERTGRSTVPNVLINGASIGGGDDVQKLMDEDKLVSSIQELGKKRIVSVVKNKGVAAAAH